MLSNSQFKNLQKLVKELKATHVIQFHTPNDICVPISKNVTSINVINLNAIWESNEIKIPKVKPLTVEYVLGRIEKMNGRVYVNHRETFKKLAEKLKLNVTPYSYGLGMESIFHSHENMHKDADKITEVLKSKGIEYTIGVSDASWVYQIKISKKESNINKINKIIND